MKKTQNALWLMGGSLLHKLIAFLVSIWMARQLGPGDFGLLNYAAAYTTFFFSLSTLGIHNVLVKRFVEAPAAAGETLGSTLVLQLTASGLSVGLISLIVWAADPNEPLTRLIVILSSFSLLFQALDTVKYWFQARLDGRFVAIATTLAFVISALYKLFLLWRGYNALWFSLATSLDYLCLAVFLLAGYRGPRLRFTKKTAKALLKASYPYIFSGLMVSVYGATDRLMLKQLLSPEAVGQYGIALSLASVWVFVLAAIVDTLKPGIFAAHRESKTAFDRQNRRLYAIVFYLSLAVSVGMIFLAELGIVTLYGEAYRAAVPALQILAPLAAFSYLGVARDAWVICENCQKYLPWLYTGAAAVNVGLNWLLIPALGISGAALASLITQIATVFVLPLFIKPLQPNVKMMTDAVLLRHLR